MSTDYQQLLEATLRHLEDLKARGVRYVNIQPATLSALARSAPPRPAQRPAAAPKPASKPAPQAASPVSAGSVVPAGMPAGAAEPAPLPPARGESPPPAGLTPADKSQAMEELRRRALACVRCPHLAAARRNVVFGVGDINAALMFVGEAPGADEDAQGEPFVGAAGQLLTRIIQTMGLSRQTVYIANILKCRPDTPRPGSGNRPPTEEEMETCIPYLLEQIDLIGPKVIVALGATAVKGLLHHKTGITRLRGQWQVFRGIPTMPTYHPAYLLRNQALAEKRKVWEDMLQVMARLGLPISEKQRGYFLNR
jgi:DNA polymerase